jgi:hypothetical protein
MLDANSQKTPLVIGLPTLIQKKINDQDQAGGQNILCTVKTVNNPWNVTVTPACTAEPAILQPLTVPVLAPPYIAYPIQPGDAGIVLQIGMRLGSLSGAGGGTPRLTDTVGNLATGAFLWLGNLNWTTPDPEATVISDGSRQTFLQVGATGLQVTGANPNLFVDGNLGSGNGATGSFTTPTGQTVTVTNGIITNIF